MSSNFETFHALHHNDGLFVLPNAWDANSAAILQEQQFPAIGTSSHAVAGSLGYTDGEGMPFTDYLFVIKRILATVKVPVTVDLEMGYGNTPEAILNNVLQLAALGVAGINIEDSAINSAGRTLQDADAFARTITHLKNNADIFVNIRCDTFLLNVPDKQAETLRRLNTYASTGADGIFLPCIAAPEDITAAIQATRLPLNVMCIPGLPDFDTLQQLGVKRVSMGGFLFNKIYDTIRPLSQDILRKKSFSSILI